MITDSSSHLYECAISGPKNIVAFVLQRHFLFWKQQHEAAADGMFSVRTGLGGDHSLRVSPFACVNHFISTSVVRSGLSSPGMKWPTNQPLLRVGCVSEHWDHAFHFPIKMPVGL